ncbi:MAG: prenyltransferase/squalene oxidase [uncultured bacterium]|nr:MAG: prenyltransferase/squalene oxidase [uncultured bacterium]
MKQNINNNLQVMTKFFLVLVMALVLFPLASRATDINTYHARVQTPDGIIYNGEIYMSSADCIITDDTGDTHTVAGTQAICLVQLLEDMGRLDATFGYYDGIGLYLKSITDLAAANYTNDDVNYSEFWSYYVNYVSPSVGMDAYALNDGDDVVIAFGPYTDSALRLRVTDNEVLTGDKIITRVQIAANTEGTKFNPVKGAKVYFNDTSITTDKFGKASYEPTVDETAVTVYATNNAALISETQTITVVKRNKQSIILTEAEIAAMATAGVNKIKDSIDGTDGLIFSNQSISEWAAMALAANGTSAGRLSQGVLDYDPTIADGTNEIARHILALVALGYDPYSTNGIDYVARLKKTKEDKQFGSSAYINDDIFAGLALLAAGETGNSDDVSLALRAAKKGLNSDGGVAFGVASPKSDVDTTAFFFQFLVAADKAGSTVPMAAARKSALAYIYSQQNLDGGFGYSANEDSNAASTAVVIQMLNSAAALIDAMPATMVSRNLRNPYNYLQSIQKDNGQFAYSNVFSSNYDVFNTTYAVIGLTQQALPIIK